MAVLAAIAAGGAQLMKAHSIEKAKIAEGEAYVEAKNRVMGATTRDMAEEERTKETIHSRAVALAAAQGGGVDDVSVVQILGDLNAEGEYRIMSKLWTGQNESEGLIFRSEQAYKEANSARDAGIINAFTAGASAYAAAGSFGGGSTALPSSSGSATPPAAAPTPRTA